MSARPESAPYTLAILLVTALVTGALLLTVTDPVMQALFGSGAYTAETANGKSLLSWMGALWSFVPAAILLMFLIKSWVDTRQPT